MQKLTVAVTFVAASTRIVAVGENAHGKSATAQDARVRNWQARET
jgi:hypothetical protein